MNREEAILHELNLYPLWQRREVATVRSESVASVPPAARDAHPMVGEPVLRDDLGLVNDMGWPELKAVVKECTACGLRAGCKQTVFGVGDEKAGWLFVGEGPGAEEDAQGEPFVGEAGKLLDKMIAAIQSKHGIQIRRGEDAYIANIVKCRPPGNRTPHAEEVAACMPYLQRQIALIKPGIIVALGKTAANALLSKDATLGSLRGTVHDYGGIPLVITYHPAYLLRAPQEKAKAWQDLCLAVETIRARLV